MANRREPKQADPIGDNVKLDEALVSELPPGCEILSVSASGKSLCVATIKIVVRLSNGQRAQYFKKGTSDDVGALMMKSSFEAERALHGFVPDLIPRPVAWGTYRCDPSVHFYLYEFVQMNDGLPGAADWASTISTLHKRSMGKSPTGQFGFHVTTHLGNIPVDNSWNSSWEKFFAQQMRSMFDRDDEIHGLDEELTGLKQGFLNRVIPRYLRPLETDGRSIEPCLIHSDLWPGNIKPRSATDELCMFDSCAYWGHNEADLGITRNPRYKLGPLFVKEYHERVTISELEEDFDKRLAIYAIKFHALLSVMYKDQKMRNVLRGELKELVNGMQANAAHL